MSFCHFLFSQFQNLKMKDKLLIIYLFVSIIALITLTAVIRIALNRQLFAHERSTLEYSLKHNISQLESQIGDIINLSNVIYNNDSINSACNVAYEDDYFQMYTAYSNNIKPHLSVYKHLIPEITNIRIYTSCGLIADRNYIQDLSVLASEPWFEQIQGNHSPQWIVNRTDSSASFASVRKLPQIPSYPFDNYLCLETNYDLFFSYMQNLSQSAYGVVITDQNQSLIYQYSSFPKTALTPDVLKLPASYEETAEQYGEEYLFLSAPVESAGWNVYYYSSINTVLQTVDRTVYTTFMMIASCFILLFSLTFFTVNNILSPLRQLTKIVNQISFDHIEEHTLLLIPGRGDEIGELIHAFNSMVKRIRNLINETYVQSLKAKEYQLNALRAQINPHFLHNTLSMISARAIVAAQPEISEMVRLLPSFYRTSLNNGQEYTTIENEMKNVQAYLSLQLFLTNHSFAVEYHLDPKLLDCSIPCLILQPIVENSIEHGLRPSRKANRKLNLSLEQEEGVCCIKVEDNGIGIEKDVMDTLFSLETSHIGIKNVNERLKLSYGNKMGLRINSSPEWGTIVIIRLPIVKASLEASHIQITKSDSGFKASSQASPDAVSPSSSVPERPS